MIIHINGYPGVGKLTIARHLSKLLNGKLLDNHSIYNIAFALTEFRTPGFYQTVRAVRDIAYGRLLDLPATTPVVVTNWYSQDSTWGVENWDEVIALARRRVCPLFVVILTCSPEENARRIQNQERAAKRKPQDPELVGANKAARPLLDYGGDALLRLDVTSLPAETAAESIAQWNSFVRLGSWLCGNGFTKPGSWAAVAATSTARPVYPKCRPRPVIN